MAYDCADTRKHVFKVHCKTCTYESCIGKHCQDCEVFEHDGCCYCNGEPTDGERRINMCAKYKTKALPTHTTIAKTITDGIEKSLTDAMLKVYSKPLTSISVPSVASVDSEFEKLADRITAIETKLNKLFEILSL